MSALKKLTRIKNDALRKAKKTCLVYLFKAKKSDTKFNPSKVKNILLLRLDDKIGDMVVITGTAKILAEQGYKVYVLAGPVCQVMLKNCKYLNGFFLYKNRMPLGDLQKIGFDAVIDFDDVHDYERLKLLWKIKANYKIGFNKKGLNVYNISVDFLSEDHHITERHKKLLELFEINNFLFSYALAESPEDFESVKKALNYRQGDKIISINPFTGAEDKDFSDNQVIKLIHHIHSLDQFAKIVIIGQTKKVMHFAKEGASVIHNSTINTAIEIIRISDLVISADTSVVHISNALDKNLIAIYNKRKLKDTGLCGYKIWAPGYSKATQIVVDEQKISEYNIINIFPLISEYLEKY